MAKRKELGFICYVNMPGRGAVPFDDLSAADVEAFRAMCARRISEELSAFYFQHPEEYGAL